MLPAVCPHCAVKTSISFFPKGNEWGDPLLLWAGEREPRRTWISNNANAVRDSIVAMIREVVTTARDQTTETYHIGRCEGCKRPVFVVTNKEDSEILRLYPPVSLARPKHVPDGVADDFVEGTLCLSVGAFKAAVAMFRRSLQATARTKNAKGTRLLDQLDNLGERGILNTSLLEVAHQIRHFGNYGAHPDEDGLGDVGKEEAEAVRQLTWQVLEDVWVNPENVASIKAALEGKKKKMKDAESSARPEDQPGT